MWWIADASGCFSRHASSALPVSDFVVTARKESGAAARSGPERFHGETILAADTALVALRPDVLPGLSSIEVVAKRADGTTDVLLFAKDIPFEWPTPYIFKEPVRVRRGTKMAVTAYVQDGVALPDGCSAHRVRCSAGFQACPSLTLRLVP